MQELVLSYPVRKKALEKRAESEENFVLQSNGKIREKLGKKMKIIKNKHSLLTTAKVRRERAAPQLLVSNFSPFSNRLNNFTFLLCVCVFVCSGAPGWQVGPAGGQTTASKLAQPDTLLCRGCYSVGRTVWWQQPPNRAGFGFCALKSCKKIKTPCLEVQLSALLK